MKLKDVWVNVKPKIDVTKATEAAKTFGEALQGGLKGVKSTVLKVKGGYDKWKGRVDKGIAILSQITSLVDKMYDKVVDLTGTAGEVADLAYALGTTETRLLAVQRAFGEAGMGNVSALDDMLVKYQQLVTDGKINLLEGQDTITGFLDMLVALNAMDNKDRAEVLQEIGFGKQTREMNKIINTDFELVRKILQDETFRARNIKIADNIPSASDTGDRMEYLQREHDFNMLILLEASNATKDAIKALEKTHKDELERAKLYKEGDLKEGARIKGLIDAVQTTIPNLLKDITTALTGNVDEKHVNVAGFKVGLGPTLSRLLQALDNILLTLQNTGTQLLDAFDNEETNSNN